jgi:hypothetical protein
MAAAKVFGIGLNKTGTRSLAMAMRMLGHRTLHKGAQSTSDLVDRAHHEGVPLLTYIGEQFDAYFDVDAIVRRYADIDAQYPGSRFILTTRELDGWLRSREKHVLANQERAARREYAGSWLTVDFDAWREERTRHHDAVESYFASRPDDLLVMDVAAGDGWDKLAPFIGVKAPARPFPWENREGAGTYRAVPRLQRAGKRARQTVARFAARFR